MNKNEFLTFFESLFEDSCSEELSMDTEFRYLDEWSSLTGLYFLTDMKEKYGISLEEIISEYYIKNQMGKGV